MQKHIICYFFRHGQTDLNLEHKIQGQIDSPLTEEGHTQAKELAEKLNNINFDIIFSSPLKRCVKTADPLINSKNLKFKIIHDLKEAHCGNWEGVPVQDIKIDPEKAEIREKFLSGHPDFLHISYPGGETIKQVQTRVIKGLEENIKELPDHFYKIGISTHSIVIRHFYAHVTKKFLKTIGNGEILTFKHDRNENTWEFIKKEI